MHLHADGDGRRKLQDDRIVSFSLSASESYVRTLAHPSALCVNDVCMMSNMCIICVDFNSARDHITTN